MSTSSSPPGSLAEALAAFQADLPDVRKTETAKVATKSGRDFEYRYADLADVSKAVLPKLGALGLSWITRPTLTTDGKFVLAYRLLHVSGESIEGEYPMQTGDAQAMGSAITYARRYALCAVTGVMPDSDDDGAAASRSRLGDKARRATTAEVADEPAVSGPTRAQQAKMGALFRQVEITDRDNRLAYVGDVIGRPVGSSNELTPVEAGQVIDALEAWARQTEPEVVA